MAIHKLAMAAAARQVESFCETRVPERARHQVRLEFVVRGDTITLVERRAPWRPEYGPDWSSQKIAQPRYDNGSAQWALFWRNRTERWFLHADVPPSRDAGTLLDEIDRDPTGIFWG
jgi:DUF3024 family protein